MKSMLELLREKDLYAKDELQKEAPVICALRDNDFYVYTKKKDHHPTRIYHYESVAFAFYGCFSDIEEVRRSVNEILSEFILTVHPKDLTGQYLALCLRQILREKYEHHRRGIYRVGTVVADLVQETIYTIAPNGDYELWKGEAYLGVLPKKEPPVGSSVWDAIKCLKTIPAIRSYVHTLCEALPGVVDELTVRAIDE